MQKYFLLVVLLATTNLFAQLSLDNANQSKTINFDETQSGINNGAFAGTGFNPTPDIGQLNSNGIIITGLSEGDMIFGGTYDSGDYARTGSTPPKTSGGVYGYEISSGNMALGIQPGGSDFTKGEIILKVKNTSGSTLNSINIKYTIYCYNDQDRSNYFKLLYSTDNDIYNEVDGSLYLSAEAQDASPSWVAQTFDLSFNITLIDNGELFIKWESDDQSGTGSRDEFAMDDIIITPSEDNIPMDVSDKKEAKTKLYPVPFKESVTIESNKNISGITIMNAVGTQVLNILGNELQKQTIETEKLNKGVYLIKITFDDNSSICKKIIKN